MPSELPRAFESGISFDASAVKGFMNIEESDLFLFPDPNTLAILPWRPSQGRVVRFFCDIKHSDGSAYEGDGRNILKIAVDRAKKMNFQCKFGTECEFYLFDLDEQGNPTDKPHDNAGYLDIAPMDKCENVRREICLTLEQMGIVPEASHHEQGPGQNEVDFKYSDALFAADNLVTFKSVVKTIAARNGTHASFMPKPIQNKSGNGLHINISLFKNGLNIFKNSSEEHSKDAESFIAGVMRRINEISLILNPLNNSYQRLGSFEAPKYVSWSHHNRSQLIRIPAEKGEYARMELRSPDPSCNPYFAFALLIHAGLEGIKDKRNLEGFCDSNLYELDENEKSKFERLPENLNEAIHIASSSTFLKEILPQRTIEKFIEDRKNDWNRYEKEADKQSFEHEVYFYTI
jgi:glutamine synthetase